MSNRSMIARARASAGGFVRTSLLSLSVAALTAAALLADARAAEDDALFRELGGHEVLTHVAEDLVETAFADPRIAGYYDNVSKPRLKKLLFEYFCMTSGGPCEYSGRSMERSHAGLNIDRAAFNALVEDLQGALDRNGVPFRVQNKLLARLAPTHRIIEER